jgi:hypothetical protein
MESWNNANTAYIFAGEKFRFAWLIVFPITFVLGVLGGLALIFAAIAGVISPH